MTALRLILFLLPLILLALWLYARQRAMRAGEAPATVDMRVAAMLGALILVVMALAFWVSHDGGAGGGAAYIPPHMEDGKIVPGRFEEAPAKDDNTPKGDGAGNPQP